jgi:hypothetical protein
MNNPEQMRLVLARKLSPDTVYLPTSARLLIDSLVGEPTTLTYYKQISCCRDTTLTVVESDRDTPAPIPASRETLVFYVLALAHVVDLTPAERAYLLSRIPATPEGAVKHGTFGSFSKEDSIENDV